MNSKRILVTGATGFIGSALFRRLKADGHAADGISLHGGIVDGEEISSVDINSEEALLRYFSDRSYKAIFHTAACIPHMSGTQVFEDCFYPNISSVKNIAKLTARDRNCHLIYASSAAVYGRNKELPLNESSLPMPENYYALSKYIGELVCQLYDSQLPVTVFRISSPYGPGYNRMSVINLFCKHALMSRDLQLLGSGKRSQDFVFIDDIVDAFLLSFKNRCPGVFNLCSGESISMQGLAELIISLVPDSRSKLIFSEKIDPQENFRARYSTDNVSRVLGFSPKMIVNEGLKETLSWWITQL